VKISHDTLIALCDTTNDEKNPEEPGPCFSGTLAPDAIHS